MMGRRMKRILLTWGQPSIQREGEGTQQKRPLSHFIFVLFCYCEWNKNILKCPTVCNEYQKTTLPEHRDQSVLVRLTLIKRKLGELKAIFQTFKSKLQSWWKSPVARVCFRQQTATGFPSGRENPCVISASLATHAGPMMS